MCIFSSPVPYVADTRIFARLLPRGRQAIIYQMVVETETPTAMILPLPIALPPRERGMDGSIRFQDLKAYPNFFTDLARLFPPQYSMEGYGGMAGGYGGAAPARPRLVVYEVGDYIASFVPTPADFSRLDPHFVLGPEVWSKLPQYADYGFAVFQLKVPAKKRAQVHPIAFDFTSRYPNRLFFPTVHIHDGVVLPQEHFDHALYFQTARPNIVVAGNMERARKTTGVVDTIKSRGLFEPSLSVYRWSVEGYFPNQDSWITA